MRAEGSRQAAVEERDLRRALRAAEKAGVSMQRVEIDREGRIILISQNARAAKQRSAGKLRMQS
jgi:hypothetical protein